MNIISKDIAFQIAVAHEEVSKGEAMLLALREADRSQQPVEIRDVFGRLRSGYEFGVPLGNGGHRLYGVSPSMAKYVVEAHIAAKKKELSEACVKARMELDGMLAEEGTPE